MNDSSDSLTSGLVYEDIIALRWSVNKSVPSPVELAHMRESNEQILRIIYFLDEYYVEGAEEHSISQELARMDFKLNLLLDLVGEVLAYYHDIPKRLPTRLSTQTIEWETNQPPPLNSQVTLELYLNPKYPHPLLLPGQVRIINPAGSSFWVTVALDTLDEITQEWLEKIIFRHHRRQVALIRRRLNPNG